MGNDRLPLMMSPWSSEPKAPITEQKHRDAIKTSERRTAGCVDPCAGEVLQGTTDLSRRATVTFSSMVTI
ncbi:Uncharacterized protein DAT39_016743 [Clarias magur]|uniref:Uncharacterized protein n=1 Tax=Clarias magur TaxID=1594786 RepID=A0A8J4TWV6_CLAMG|nr:Uncharacterized protein DAT39_016743 [Clarias magur]